MLGERLTRLFMRLLVPPGGAGRCETGQDAAEYALLVGFIAIVIVGAVAVLGTNLSAAFHAIQSNFMAAF